MAVLITGGAGFVGSHLADRLIKRGEHVVVCDDLSTGRLANLHRGLSSSALTFIYLDVTAPLDVIRAAVSAATSEPFSAIFHLASPPTPLSYGDGSWQTLSVDALSTMSMINFALEQRARMVFASTPESFDDPARPGASSSEGKRFGEAAMSVAMRERGLDGRVVRIFNCYGPRMNLNDGRLVPALVSAAREKRPFPVQGSGQQMRSMTYVDDLVDGLLAVASADVDIARPFNLASDSEVTMMELAALLADVAGVALVTDSQWGARLDDPEPCKPDLARAHALGWAPRTNLRDGLRRTYSWAVTEAAEFV